MRAFTQARCARLVGGLAAARSFVVPVSLLGLMSMGGACAGSSSQAGAGEGGGEARGTRVKAPKRRPADTDPAEEMVMHFIDVGQGDATLLEFPCGVVVIDTGGEKNEGFDGEAAYRDYLTSFFDAHPDRPRRIDLLAITHPHIDHTRSVEWTIENFEVKNVLHNGQVVEGDPGTPPQQAMVKWARSHPEVGELAVQSKDVKGEMGLAGPIVDPVGSCARSGTDPKIQVLWGRVHDADKTYGENPNDHSLVLRVDFGESSALFTGDLQMMGLARMTKRFEAHPELFDVDVYQVGHHGSHNATKPYFVELMSPRVAVVSMGAYERDLDWTARRYGHPHRRAMGPLIHPQKGVSDDRDEAKTVMFGVRGAWEDTPSEFEPRELRAGVYATGWDGTVRVHANANGWLDVETQR